MRGRLWRRLATGHVDVGIEYIIDLTVHAGIAAAAVAQTHEIHRLENCERLVRRDTRSVGAETHLLKERVVSALLVLLLVKVIEAGLLHGIFEVVAEAASEELNPLPMGVGLEVEETGIGGRKGVGEREKHGRVSCDAEDGGGEGRGNKGRRGQRRGRR